MTGTTRGLALLTAGVMLTAGCGSAAAPAVTRSAARAAASSAGAAAGTPRQQAAASARAILASFVPPPGATRLARRPPLPGGWARYGTMGLIASTQAGAAGYWRVAGPPAAQLAWEKAHMSRRYSRQDVLVGPPSWNTVFALAPVPGVLPQRELNVQVYQAGGGTAVIMAAAMVTWQVPRPAAEVIPAGVRAVTIASNGSWRGSPPPVTVTSAAAVRHLVALLNGLPAALPHKPVPCPMGVGFVLTFRARGGAPVAVADGPAECGVIHLTLRGAGEPDLQPAGSYRAAVLKIAGLHWRLG
jgi:hypothetical protein